MDIIKLARELGKAIQQDQSYVAMHTARRNNDTDESLQKLIGDFNLKRVELNQEIGKQNRDNEKLAKLDAEIKSLYQEIMSNENMAAFNAAKQDVDRLMNFINQILVGSVNGEDPDAIQEASACSGSCSSCSGCH